MDDVYKTKRQLIEEVKTLRRRLANPEASGSARGSRDETLRRFAAAVDSVQLGVTIADRDGTILHTNPAEARMHGYEIEELLGKNARIFAPPARWRFLSTDQLNRRIDWRRESINMRKDQSTFPVELISNVVRNQAGAPIGKVTICEDITLLKRAERARRERDEYIRLVLEATSEGVWEWDIATGEMVFSDQWLDSLGYSRQDLEPHITSWEGLTHPDDLARVKQRLAAHLDGGAPVYESEKRMLGKSGEYIWKRDRGKVIRRDDEGRPLRIVGLDSDITERRRSEESRRFLASIVESSEDAIIGQSLDGQLLSWNAAAERLFGYTANEAVGKHVSIVVPPDRQDEIPHLLTRIGRGERISRYETVARRQDGSRIDISLTQSPVRDVSGRVCGAASIIRDISDRKMVAEALHVSEERYRDLVENSQGLICTHTLDGVLLSTNPAGAELFGYRPDEMVGRRIEELLAPRTRPQFADYLKEIRTQGQSSGYLRIQTRTGEERLLVYRNSVCEDPDSGPYVVGHAQDVTDLRRAQDAERVSEAKYRTLFEDATYGIFRTDARGRMVTVNPALVRMLGYESAEQLLETDVAREVYADPEGPVDLLESVDQDDRIAGLQCQWKRRDGSMIVVHLSGRAVRDAEGNIEGLEVFAEDVTRQRALESQLRQSQKMEAVGQLTGGIAHDFNNLLTVILASADLIGASLPPDQRSLTADLGELKSAARRGSAMVRRLLSFSRQTVLTPQLVDFTELVQDVLVTLRRLLPETIEIRFTSQKPLPAVTADPAAVEQILMNLTTNARDAMPAGGRIDIDASRVWFDEEHRDEHGWGDPGEYVLLRVRDTGCGMDEATRSKAFEPFFTTKEPEKGTGLGLAMIYGLMKQHNGFVDVESVVGRGSTVNVYFPLAHTEAPPAGQEAEEPEGRGGTETILYVEDEVAIRRAAKRVLEHHGYTVLSAADGEEALSLFQAKKGDIALVVSDLVMPKMGGVDLFESVTRESPGIKFLWTSGYALPDVQASVPRGDNVAFLQKPWMPKELLGMVRDVLDAGVGVGQGS